MIRKQGVLIDRCWQYEFMYRVVDFVYRKVCGHESFCTSGCEVYDFWGRKVKHSDNSLHWQGLAWDFRIWKNNDPAQGKLDTETLSLLVSSLKKYLGDMFDVVLEEDHIHIEYDPK